MSYNHRLPDNLTPDGDTCVPIFLPDDPQWIASFISVVKLLHQDKRWVRDNVGGVDTLTVRNRWKETTFKPLITTLSDGNGCAIQTDFDYSEQFVYYPAYAPLIEYLPVSPFEDVDQTPQLSLLPAWNVYGFELPNWLNGFLAFFGTSFETITGYRRGDAITTVINMAGAGKNITQILGDWLFDNEGFSLIDIGFNIHVRGEGVMQVELLSVPQGSTVIYQVDGVPNITDALTGILDPNDDVLDTNRDLTSFPPELDAETLEEIVISGAGDHVVRFRVFPRLNDELIPLSFGAGLRSVRLGDGLTALDWRTGQPFTQESTGALGSNEEGLYLVTESEYNNLVASVQALNDFVANHCNEVEQCLTTSPTIATMQSGIADNANDITLLKSDIVDVDARISDNLNDITLLKSDVIGIEDRVSQNEIGINLLKGNQLFLLSSSGVEYDEPPVKEVAPDETCGSAWRIALDLEQFITDTVNDAQSITLSEYISGILPSGGVSESLLVQLWNFALVNANPNLLSDVSASVSIVAQAFYCNNLKVADARADILADTGFTTDAQTAWIGAIDSWLISRFNKSIAIGRTETFRNCSQFCNDWELTWLPPSLSSDFVVLSGSEDVPNNEVVGAWDGNSSIVLVQVEFTVPIGAIVNEVEFGCNWNATRLKPNTSIYENIGRVIVDGVIANDRVWQDQSNIGNSVSLMNASITEGQVIRVQNFVRANSANDGAYCNAQLIRIKGTGTPPVQ